MFARHLRFAAAALTLAALPAQRTWIVDALNGAGTHFLDVPPALAVAVHGDTVLVRPAQGFPYTPGRTTQGITLLHARFDFARGAFVVDALPAGRAFVMAGVVSRDDDDPLRLELRNCAGAIHLSNVRSQDPGPTFPVAGGGVSIRDCALVTLSNCGTWGSPALRAERSRALVRGGEWRGLGFGSTAAVIAEDARLSMIDPIVHATGDGTPGIDAVRSELRLTGSASAFVQGGGFLAPVPAVQTSGGSVEVAPWLRFNPFFPGPDIVGTAIVTRRALAGAAGALHVGAPSSVRVFADVNAIVQPLLALPGGPWPTPFGEFWLDPATVVPLAPGTVGANHEFARQVWLPAAVRDLAIAVQAVALQGAALEFSEPDVAVVQ